MKTKKFTQAFTLVEIIVAMALAAVIMTMIVVVGAGARRTAQKRKAEAMIAALEVAIGMYHADTGNYPDTDNGSGCERLYDHLTNSNYGNTSHADYKPGWHGEYMKFRDEDLSGTPTQIIDPWSANYNYETPGDQNTTSFDLWSIGPDDSEGTLDDITNW